MEIPNQAQIVIIGGGIIGCSAAYHLAKMGCKDVLLLEQNQLTSGSTWHAAGAIGQLRSSSNVTRLLGESVKIYQEITQETGLETGWRQNGSLRLACTQDRKIEYERALASARSFGIEFEIISPSEAQAIHPLMNVDDLLCAAYVPSDGVANPSDITQALAKGARSRGARLIEGVTVTGVDVVHGEVKGIQTNFGHIKCETLINCAGIWSRELGEMAGVNIPIQPSHHQYFVTEPIPGMERHAPAIRDPDKLTYFKEEVGGLAIGAYELNPIPFKPHKIPGGHEFKLYPDDMDQIEHIFGGIYQRFPCLENIGIRNWFNGLESFTEDGMFILGEAPEVKRFFVATGFNAFGIAAGGGAGAAIANWVLEGAPPFDLWAADIRRFGGYHSSRSQVMARSLEGQGDHYRQHYPFEEKQSGRPLRLSAVHHRLKENGACFGTKFGWERPNWFAPEGVESKDILSMERQNWFEHVRHEHNTCRNAVSLFDQSYFSKFKLVGSNAERELQKICAANIEVPINRVVYTQMLNERGGIEADLTITRQSDDEFNIITGTGFATRDFNHIKQHLATDSGCVLMDVTSAYGCLTLMGPKAREVLGSVAEGDIDNEHLPMGWGANLFIDGAPAYAIRVSFVGELGWEIYIPSEYMTRAYDALKRAGEEHGICDAGYRAIDSLRLEKARRVWGHDIGPDYTPYEAGLGFAVDLEKPEFIGREALLRQRSEGIKKKFASFLIEDTHIDLLGGETLYRDGEVVGWLASGGYGHTLDKPIGLGYIRSDSPIDASYVRDGDYAIGVRTEIIPAEVCLGSPFDPKNEKCKG